MKRYAAVSIITASDCCEAVKEMTGVRILARDAPTVLPLSQCSMPDKCRCRFRKYSDRRDESGERRHAVSLSRYEGKERRKSGGRRADDV